MLYFCARFLQSTFAHVYYRALLRTFYYRALLRTFTTEHFCVLLLQSTFAHFYYRALLRTFTTEHGAHCFFRRLVTGALTHSKH